MTLNVPIAPGSEVGYHHTNVSDSGGSSWGFTVGNNKCGADGEDGYYPFIQATSFAEFAAAGAVKRWSATGLNFTANDPSGNNRDCLARVEVDAHLEGETYGSGGTGKVDVELVLKNYDKNIEETHIIAHHESTALNIDWFDEDISDSSTFNMYHGDEYLVELRLKTEAYLPSPYTMGSGDAGPYDGDGDSFQGLTVNKINFDYFDG